MPIEGEIQRLTPTIDALYVPDIDDSLDEVRREAALLVVVPRARRLVRPAPAVLINLHLPGLCPAGYAGMVPLVGLLGDSFKAMRMKDPVDGIAQVVGSTHAPDNATSSATST